MSEISIQTRSGRDGDSQPMPGTSDQSENVTPALILDIQQHGEVTGLDKHKVSAIESLLNHRTELGIRRYGHPLQTLNGRDATVDAREEIADACQYLKQRLMEHPTYSKYRIALWNAIALLFMVMEDN